MERILTIDDFGTYSADVHRHFTEAFGFAWSGGPETRETGDARLRLHEARRRALSEPSLRYRQEEDILGEAYELQRALSDYLAMTDPALSERVAAMLPRAAEAGRLLNALRSVRGHRVLAAEQGPEFDETVAGLESRWVRFEDELAAVYAAAQQVASVATDGRNALAELDQDARMVGHELKRLEMLVATALAELAARGNAPDLSALRIALKRTERAVAAVQESVQHALSAGPATPSKTGSGPFKRYFARVLDLLPVIETRYYRAGETARPRRPVKRVFEVPWEHLVVRRTADERREAMLCFLATFRAEFREHLPAACRQDHRPPQNSGGPGNRNIVLAGIAAAMVITEQLVAQPGDKRLPGDKLFGKVVTRTRQMLVRAGRSGRLVVRTPVTSPRPTGNGPTVRTRQRVRPPLMETHSTSVVHIEQRRLAEHEVWSDVARENLNDKPDDGALVRANDT